jgi:hypothetical protein
MSQAQPVEPAGSIASQDPHREDKKKTKSRRPASEQHMAKRCTSVRGMLIEGQILRFGSSD